MKKIIGVFFVFCLFVSCEINVEVKFDRETFYAQKQLWQTSNITDYKYHLRAIGWDGYDGTIIVENGNYKDNVPVDEHFEMTNYMLTCFSTIDEMYKTIEDLFNGTNNKKQSINEIYLNEIFVVYDKINHIPKEIHYKYHYPVFPAVTQDGTYDYYINEFEKTN
jgi:hypothetical protein